MKRFISILHSGCGAGIDAFPTGSFARWAVLTFDFDLAGGGQGTNLFSDHPDEVTAELLSFAGDPAGSG